MKFKAVLNIKSIIRFEQLTGKPFSEIDYENSEDTENLLYAAAICSNDGPIHKDGFMTIIKDEKIFADMVKSMKNQNEIIEQFTHISNNDQCDKDTSSDHLFVYDAAASLILEGVDPDFIYNMWLCDFSILVNAYNRKKRESLEDSRLWTYLTILPHIESKKIKTPTDLYPFPWEQKDVANRIQQQQDYNEKMLYKFINGEIKV
nr:hypothetical protein [uncultured Macellibacteroides sp.]